MNTNIKGDTQGVISENLYTEQSHREKEVIINYDVISEDATLPQDNHTVNYAKLQLPLDTHTVAEQVSYPEGGLRAWLVVLGSFCGTVASFGFMNSIGVYQEYLSHNQLAQYSESVTGWIFSVYIFLSFGCGLLIGPVFDAKGPTILVLVGGICLVTGLLILSISTQYWHIMLSIGVLMGFGTSLIFTPAVAVIGHFFLVKRGAATGLSITGGSIGGIIFPLMLQRLFPMLGFAWATRVLALLFIVLCGICVLLVRSRLPPLPGSSLLPDLRIYSQPAFTLATIGVFFHEWALFIPITYISSFIVSTGAASPTSRFPVTLIAILNVGSTIGRYLPGVMADRFGRFNSMIVMLSLCVISNIGLWLPASMLSSSSSALKPLAIVYAAAFGFASGSNISLTPVCIGQLCVTEEYGRYYATCYTVVALGSLTGIPIAGALIQAAGGSYFGMVMFTGLCYVASFTAFLGARWFRVGWKMVMF